MIFRTLLESDNFLIAPSFCIAFLLPPTSRHHAGYRGANASQAP
jgi:hypothetical protein